MAQTIKIKRSTGSAAPTSLAVGELAYSKGSDTFYVGDPATANTPIAIGGALKNNAGTVQLATGITAAAIRTAIGVDAAGTDNSTNVTLAGTPDYITISGQTITRNAVNLATDITGTLAIGNGGTGATTAAQARTNLGVDAAGTDNSTDVTLLGSLDYITISGQAITRNAINLTTDVTGDLPVSAGGTGSSTASGARTNLGLAIGTNVQAYDADLTAIAGLSSADGNFIVGSATGWVAESGATARTSLGLGSLATLSSVGAAQITDNSVGAAELNVSGNGSTSQFLRSDGDGTFTWATPTDTNDDVSVSNLEARLPQIDTAVTIGNGVTVTAGGDFVVTGDLTVSGTTTTVNSETIALADNIIELNSNLTGTDTPTEDAGIRVNRGSGVDQFLYWDEGNDRWETAPVGGAATPVGSITGVTAGTGLAGGGTSGGVTLNVDLSELTDMTAAMVGTDEFIVLDAGADRRKAASEIGLSIFNNDAGFTTNVGDITNVSAGTGLSGGGASGSVTLSLNFAELTDMTADIAGTTEFILQNGAVESRKAASEIKLSAFNNDAGWTSNAGDITNVTAGTGLSGGGASGSVTLNVDLSELTDMTAAVVGSQDELILLDNGADRRKLISEISLSQFNNDAGWTSNAGDITAVTISSTDGSISGGGVGSTGALSFDLEVATIDGGIY